MKPVNKGFDVLQKIAMSIMAVLVLITFLGANLQAVLWQSSDWLVSTVLPAVVVDLTNQERADNSALPLQRNSTLDAAAQLKAEHMAKNEYFSHFSPKGVSPWHWFNESGYVFAHAGENLAIHFTDSTEVVEAWMDSPTHRQNIVDGKFTEIGVGTAKGEFDGYKTVYVVQLFGTPAVVPVEKADIAESASLATAEEIELADDSAPVIIKLPAKEAVLAIEVDAVLNTEVVPEPIFTESQLTVDEVIEVEPVIVVQNIEVTTFEDSVVLESPVIATSSGLAVANITTPNISSAGATLASYATKPNQLLQIVYTMLALAVVVLLSVSVTLEVKQLRYTQVAYGLMLLVGMSGLWYAHSLLTTGAVIV